MITIRYKTIATLLLLTILVLSNTPLRSQGTKDSSNLTIERIFGKNEFSSESFGPVRWEKDGNSYSTLEKSPTVKDGQDIVLYSAANGSRRVVVPASQLIPANDSTPLDIDDYQWSKDGNKLLVFTNTKRVWRQNTRGDYWVLDIEKGTLKKLGARFEPSRLMFAKFSPNGNRVAYVYKNDIYTENLDDGVILQLTHDGSETIVNGTSDWVYEEEFDLRDGFRWSPDNTSIAFWQFDTKGAREFHLINNTDSLYPRIISFPYPKVGEMNSAVRIGVVPAAGGEPIWMNVPGDPRNNYIPRIEWIEFSNELMMQHFNRRQNQDDVLIGNVTTGEVRTVYSEKDSAWVDVMDDLFTVDKGKWISWLSERDGWRHVYLLSTEGKEAKSITHGDFDVIGIQSVDEKGGWVYYTASPENATQLYLYRARLNGEGMPQRISPSNQPGWHSYQISPSAKWAIHTYSNFDMPPTVELVKLPDHQQVRVLSANKSLKEKINALNLTPVEFFKIDIGGGVLLDGWRIKPPGFNSTKSYPLFFYVYGEPAGQTVVDRWGGNRGLWHQMLAQHGYIVASIDSRGMPAPRGREWRKCIYKKIGVLPSGDHALAVEAIGKQWHFIDTSRIGIWGWSGGGSSTLNAMFRHPDLYKTGMAVAAVTNERYYDDVYEERYMGLLTDENADSIYKECSAITYAKNLTGNLLIVHGTGDDNVHYQNCESLINDLVAFDKHFTMMAYPNRTHSISQGKNTTRHLFETLTTYLEQNMPAGKK
ncbi:MAG: S9 family peptidase [Bacteroidota bacterium]